MPNAPPDWEEVARYLSGECSADDAATITQWLDAHPQDAALIEAMNRHVERLQTRVSSTPVDVEGALKRVRNRKDAAAVLPFPARRSRGLVVGRGWRIAAALGVVAAGLLAWSQLRESQVAVAPPAPGRTYATAVGAVESVKLPDGTGVVLGSRSELTVPANFGAERLVMLRGEAFFEVIHDAARPFTVVAGDARVQDIGTAFVVRQDAESGVRVAVTEGTVILSQRRAAGVGGQTLQAGDVGTLDRTGRVRATRGTAAPSDTNWTGGKLVFRDTPLVDVGLRLKRWYGIDLVVTDPELAGRRMNTDFSGDSIGRMLQDMALAIGATAEQRGDTVEIRRVRRR